MHAALSDLLAEADARGGAVGAFTSYNFETAVGILRAAERRGRGAILLVSQQSLSAPGGDLLLRALVAAADAAPVAACVEVDHVADPVLIERAFALGAGAVLADGSRLPLDENIRFVQAAAARGQVEAELGGIEGDEDVAAAVAAGALTEPAQAARFVEETGAACLAVSIGNVHGRYRSPPSLDWPRLEAIANISAIPLSLHGASGLPDADIRRAISLGVRKVNVNTELREEYLAATEKRIGALRAGARVLELNQAQSAAVAAAAERKLDVFG